MVHLGPYAISDKRPGIAIDIFDANRTSIADHGFLAGDDQKVRHTPAASVHSRIYPASV